MEDGLRKIRGAFNDEKIRGWVWRSEFEWNKFLLWIKRVSSTLLHPLL